MIPSDEDILDRFARINIWKRGSERAPHKPLLLLYALAALQRGEERLIPFARIEENVGRLLHDFGPPRATRPGYPFWHLQSDGLWEIPEHEALQADLDEAPHRHNPRLTMIRDVGAHGALPQDLYEELITRHLEAELEDFAVTAGGRKTVVRTKVSRSKKTGTVKIAGSNSVHRRSYRGGISSENNLGH